MKDANSGFESLRTTMFGGYKKEDVMEYIDFLLSEAEGQKAQTVRVIKENDERLRKCENEKKELENKLNQLEEKIRTGNEDIDNKEALVREQEEIEKLKKINDVLNKRIAEAEMLAHKEKACLEEEREIYKNELSALKQQEEEREKKYKELEEKVKVYDQRSEAVFEVLTEARLKAENVLVDAQSKASDMLEQTQKDIYLQKKSAEKILYQEIETQIENFIITRAKINEYLDKVSEIQNGLEQVYSSMNKVAGGIPVSVDQLKAMEENLIVDDELLLEGDKNPE